jgi:hypothetical protein
VGGHFEFVALYETALLKGEPQKVVVDPLKIELLPSLPRYYSIDQTTLRTLATGERGDVTQEHVIALMPPMRYIVLTARATEDSLAEARHQCEDKIDRGLTLLGAMLGPGVFGKRIYKGWVASRRGVIVEAWVRHEEPRRLPVTGLAETAASVEALFETDPDLADRFSLISRFYSKALAAPPSEEVFLFLWTILEVFPMKATSDIRPIGEFLSKVTGRAASEVKTNLGIGRLFGMRSDLVHNGSLGVARKELGIITRKLEDICGVVIRQLVGLPYNGSLDSYFENAGET